LNIEINKPDPTLLPEEKLKKMYGLKILIPFSGMQLRGAILKNLLSYPVLSAVKIISINSGISRLIVKKSNLTILASGNPHRQKKFFS